MKIPFDVRKKQLCGCPVTISETVTTPAIRKAMSAVNCDKNRYFIYQ